jgi:hypothetical protein
MDGEDVSTDQPKTATRNDSLTQESYGRFKLR